MSANIALRVTGNRDNETWTTSYSTTFDHEPETVIKECSSCCFDFIENNDRHGVPTVPIDTS